MALPTDASGKVVTGASGRRVNLVRVAKAQRVLLWLLVATLVIMLGRCAGTGAMGTRGSPPDLVPLIALALLQLAVGIALIVQPVRLSLATGGGIVIAVMVGILGMIPVVNLLVMLMYSHRATRILRRNGVHVGLLGVGKDEWTKMVGGSCLACGYDVRGLPASVCPECGGPVSASDTGDALLPAARAPNDLA
jgi:hypothetical protein